MITLIDNIAHLVGISIVLFSIYFGSYGGSPSQGMTAEILHIPSFVLVFGGLIGLLLSTTSFLDLMRFGRNFFSNMPSRVLTKNNYAEANLELMAQAYYRDSYKGLASSVKLSSLPEAWELIFSHIEAKIDPLETRKALEARLSVLKEQSSVNIYIIDTLIASAPSFGMLGTILGLIKLLKDLSDFSTIAPNMALALVTTLYGLLGALFLLPVAKYLERKSRFLRKGYIEAIVWVEHIKERKPAFLLNKELIKK